MPGSPPAPRDGTGRDRNGARGLFTRRWNRLWGVLGAAFLVVLLARLPAHLAAPQADVLLRDAGLALVCINMVLQALQPNWPALYALALALAGVLLWLTGVWIR